METETGKPGGSAVQEPSQVAWSAPPTPPNPYPVSPAYPPYTYGPPGWYYSPPRRSRAGRIGIFLGLTVFILFLITLIGLVLFFTFNVARWGTVGSLRTETQTVPLGTATSATVNVEMGVGDLKLSGGANDLMNATFLYNIDSWKPIVDSSVNTNAGIANLSVRQPSNTRLALGNTRYNWDLRFQNNVPLDLRVGMGVGKGELYLSGLTLTRLEISNGVGDSTLDLTGVHPQNFNVIVKGGVGKTTLRLPSDIGVRIVTHEGLGTIHTSNLTHNGNTYTNSAYGNSSATINIELNIGVGDIFLQ